MTRVRKSFILIAAAAATAGVAAAPAHAASKLRPTARSCATTSTWVQTSEVLWQLPEAGLRSQGGTTDGKSWYFSWQYGLEKTNDDFIDTETKPVAIPPSLLMAGSSHIGDIDWFKGKLVIPIEDGPDGYKHPYVAFVNPVTFQVIDYYAIPWDLQTEGVPWIAVDARKAYGYIAEWNKTTQINVLDLNDRFQVIGSIKLRTKLPRIQGAKLYDGHYLIATVDDANKTVYQIDLKTGIVTKLFSLNEPGELEGLIIRPMPDGSVLHIIMERGNIEDPLSDYHAEFHSYKPVTTQTCT